MPPRPAARRQSARRRRLCRHGTVAPQQTVATLASDPEAEIITQDGPTGRRRDHQHNGEPVRRPGVDGGHQEHGLTRKRDAGALNGHKDQDRPIPIGVEQVQQVRCCDMNHVSSAFSISDTQGVRAMRRFTSGTAYHGKPLPSRLWRASFFPPGSPRVDRKRVR